jgi:hypothetical protein
MKKKFLKITTSRCIIFLFYYFLFIFQSNRSQNIINDWLKWCKIPRRVSRFISYRPKHWHIIQSRRHYVTVTKYKQLPIWRFLRTHPWSDDGTLNFFDFNNFLKPVLTLWINDGDFCSATRFGADASGVFVELGVVADFDLDLYIYEPYNDLEGWSWQRGWLNMVILFFQIDVRIFWLSAYLEMKLYKTN